jgi:hypothetical protein
MRRALLGTLVLLLLTPPLRALDDKDKPQPDKPPATPAEQYDALAKEYDKAQEDFFKAYREAKTEEEKSKLSENYPDPAKYAQRFLDLAKKYPKDPAAVDALVWVVTRSRGGPNPSEALGILQKDHLNSPKMAEVCQALAYNRTPAAETLLRAVLETSKNHASQGQACFALAQHAKQAAAQAKRENSVDADQRAAEAEALFERVAKEFADVKSYQGTLADAAKGELFEIRFLAIGKVAPDIEGEDIDGKSLKLSDYRGKVVLLDFWGNW